MPIRAVGVLPSLDVAISRIQVSCVMLQAAVTVAETAGFGIQITDHKKRNLSSRVLHSIG